MRCRPFIVLTATTTLALALSATAAADPDVDIGPYLPGQHMNVVEKQPCDNWTQWAYGLSASGAFMACVSFDGGKTGKWATSAPIEGIRDIGTECTGDPYLAQAPDGRPLICNNGSWATQPGGNLG